MAAVKQFPEEVAQKYFKNNFSMYRKGESFTNFIHCYLFKRQYSGLKFLFPSAISNQTNNTIKAMCFL